MRYRARSMPALALATAVTGAAPWTGADAAPLGQWVWSRRDLPVLETARRQRPEVAAAVSVAELGWDGEVRTRLRLPPGVAGHPAMLTIRLDDSFHRAPPEPTGAQLDAALGRLLAATGPEYAATPVELDYDAPVAGLGVYAAWLDRCRSGSLRGRALWITSLPAQLADPGFGKRFASRVDGHVPQVFDTGEPWTPEREAALAAGLERAGIPFALGIGGFDRPGTRHADWLAALPRLARLRGFRGVWVFPAGFDWSALLRSLP